MSQISLPRLAAEQITAAHAATAGRSAHTIHGGQGHALRQTVLALVAGHALGEHESPGEATVHVLMGRVRLTAGEDSWELGAGDVVTIPPRRHDLAALEDAAVLLTVAAGG